MFALFPFLSIYLQDIDGYSPLGAGLRFLPITAFVFLVPLATRRIAMRAPMWALLAVSLLIVTVGLLLPAAAVGLGAPSGATTLVAAWYLGLTVVALALAYRGNGLGRGAGAVIVGGYVVFVGVLLAID